MTRGMKLAFALVAFAVPLYVSPAGAQAPVKKHKPAAPAGVSHAGATFESSIKAQSGYELEKSGKNGVVARMAGGGGAGGLGAAANCQCSSTGDCQMTIAPDKGSATCSKPDIANACKGDCTFKRVPSRAPSAGSIY